MYSYSRTLTDTWVTSSYNISHYNSRVGNGLTIVISKCNRRCRCVVRMYYVFRQPIILSKFSSLIDVWHYFWVFNDQTTHSGPTVYNNLLEVRQTFRGPAPPPQTQFNNSVTVWTCRAFSQLFRDLGIMFLLNLGLFTSRHHRLVATA